MRATFAHTIFVVAALFAGLSARADPTIEGFSVKLLAPQFGAFSRADCEAAAQPTVALSWSTAVAPAAGEEAAVFVSGSPDCSTDQLDLVSPTARTTQSDAFPKPDDAPVTARALFDAFTPGVACGGPSGAQLTVYLCVRISRRVGAPVFASTLLVLDSVPPAAPASMDVTALDSALLVHWRMAAGTTSLDRSGIARYRVTAEPTAGVKISVDVDNPLTESARIDGLTNGVTYAVTVVAVDKAGANGNESAPAGPIFAVPQASEDFTGRYRRLGGHDDGTGCNSAGASTFAALAALLFFLRRRAGAALLIIALASSSARAQDFEARAPSVSHWAVLLSASAYRPAIDSEPGLTGTPYRDLFGDSQLPLVRLEVQRALWSGAFGAISLGAAVGRWHIDGHARLAGSESEAADAVSFEVRPVSALVALRGDFLESAGIPFAPFVKAGYGFAYWRSGVGGWARGIEYTGGLQLVLDDLEELSATALESRFGILSTRLAIEYTGAMWQGAGGLRLSGGGLGCALVFLF